MMDRKELYLNVRKAYRLVYEVQDSIVEMIEYIRARIKHNDCAGKQLFSDPIAKRRLKDDDYADQYIGQGTWSWDYFLTYMYTYYFTGIPTETQYCCFSVIQVMDDGFVGAPAKDSAPSTKDFCDAADSESYLLFAFSIWKKDQRAIWFDYDGTEQIENEKEEIMRISDEIKQNGYGSYIVNTSDYCFIVKRINLESIGSKPETDQVLSDFDTLVFEKTGYHLLVDDQQDLPPLH